MAVQRLIFHVTDRCQLNCGHCLRDSAGQVRDLQVDLIESIMDQAHALFGTTHIGLTGGEPTLHPRFYDIIDAIADRGFSWHVVSNGEQFDLVVQRLAERPQRLEALTLMNFSLEGADEQTHDAIRRQGSFRSVLKAASVCCARSIPFLLQMTLNARNVEQIEQTALLASQLGAAKLAYSFAQPTGTDFDRSMYLPASEWQRAVDRIERVRDMFTIESFHSGTGPNQEPFRMCEMWTHKNLNVDYDGCLNLCCQHTGVPGAGASGDIAGDLHEMPLADAYERFTELVHQTIRARLRAIRQKDLDRWDRYFSCNWCLKHHGKPHWNQTGAGGPGASSERKSGRRNPGHEDNLLKEEPSDASLTSDAVRSGR